MDHRRIILPDDSLINETVGAGAPTKRAQRARLRRAERAGILPPRLYFSSQRFGYYADELEAALQRLPRSYTATLAEGD